MESSLSRKQSQTEAFVREVYAELFAAGEELFRYILEVQPFCRESGAAQWNPS
jgi:hypothetical protein